VRSLLSVGLDPAFGTGGIVQFNLPSAPNTSTVFSVGNISQENGQILAVGTLVTQSSIPTIVSTQPTDTLAVARLTNDGSLDTSFGTNGIATITSSFGNSNTAFFTADDIAVQPNGQVVVVATVLASVGASDVVVARLNTNGSLDTSFGTAGLEVSNFGPNLSTQTSPPVSLAISPDGQIVVASSVMTSGGDEFAIARLTTDGSLDTTFNGTGLETVPFSIGSASGADATGVVVQPDGKIVVVGNAMARTSTGSGGAELTNIAVARLNVDGTLDTTFNNTGELTFDFNLGPDNDTASAVTLDGSQIVIAGTSTVSFVQNDLPEIDTLTVARLNSNGTFDTTFNGTGKYDLNLDVDGLGYSTAGAGIAVLPDGSLLLGGNASPKYSVNDTAGLLVNLTTSGSLNTNYGSNGVAILPVGVSGRLLVQSDGRAVFSSPPTGNNVIGRTTAPAPQVESMSLVTTGTGGSTKVSAITVQFNTSINSNLASNVTLYRVKIGTKGNTFLRVRKAIYNASDNSVTLQVRQARVSKKGYTVFIDGSGIIKSGAEVLGNGAKVSVYVPPTVTSARNARQPARVLPSAASVETPSSQSVGLDSSFGNGGLARINLPSSLTSTSTFTVGSIGLQGGQVVAVGTLTTYLFTSTGAYESTSVSLAVARLNTDGSLDTSFGTNGIATLPPAFANSDPTTYNPDDIAVESNAQIVVLGIASQSGPLTDFEVARLNANGSLDTSFGTAGLELFNFGTIGSTLESAPASLATGPGGQIIVAGSISTTGGDEFAVARLNANGSLDTTFDGTGLQTVPFSIGSSSGALATGVAVQPDGKIVVVGNAMAGTSSQTGGGELTNIAVARLDVDGTLDTSFNSTGELTFSYDLGGTDDDTATAVTLEGSELVITGSSTVAFGPGGAVPFAIFDPAAGGQIHSLTVTRLNSNGTFDTTFNGTGKYNMSLSEGGIAYSTAAGGVTVLPDGSLLVGGDASPDYSNNAASGILVNLTAEGGLNPSYGSNGVASLPVEVGNRLLVQSDGRVVFNNPSPAANSIARTTAPAPQLESVSLVTTGTGKSAEVSAITVQFNTNVNSTLASAANLYQVKVGTKGNNLVKVRKAVYNANDDSVTLQLRPAKVRTQGYTVLISGSGIIKANAGLLNNGSVVSEYVPPSATMAPDAHAAIGALRF
jgi:uncharacterized delta-60 repeat protein